MKYGLKAPPRCSLRDRVIYDFQLDAEEAAAEWSRYASIPLAAYTDPECEHWYITKIAET